MAPGRWAPVAWGLLLSSAPCPQSPACPTGVSGVEWRPLPFHRVRVQWPEWQDILFFFLIAIWLLYNVVLVLLDNEVNRLGVYICAVLNCFSHVRLFVTLWTVARQAPLSTGFSKQEHWSGLPCLSPGNLPSPGTEPRTLALQVESSV